MSGRSRPLRDPAAFPKLVRTWEIAYREYADALSRHESEPGGNPRHVADAALRVARAWHDLSQERLPWWCVAAVEKSVESFSEIADKWMEKARNAAAIEVGSL
ncbi:hypothetical protein GCM10009754_85960 [Amycolatopsis minnesotensis]|uniref:SAV-6107-like HEPN domain-containing protein n=2 Tax=Amycolatopsis minnesotensis TaxID=337894 RepID=A0ABN2SVX0_9PSEU